MTISIRHTGALLALPAALLASPGLGQTGEYAVIDLGTIGGPDLRSAPGSGAFDLNADDVVVGYSGVQDIAEDIRAFRWENGLTDLGAAGADPHSRAMAINDAGIAVGISYVLGDLVTHGVRWDGTTPVVLGALAPRDINNAGVIVGEMPADTTGLHAHAFRWVGGAPTDLFTLGGSHSSAAAVNDGGRIVGTSFLADESTTRAFLWQSGVMSDLGTLGGGTSQAYDINDAGQVVGVSDTAAGMPHAFRYDLDPSGAVISRTDLGTLDGASSFALGINAGGAVVGTSGSRAFLSTGGAPMTDLNDAILTDTGWHLTVAAAINDPGHIAGTGVHRGQGRAFLLRPREAADFDGDGMVGFSDLLRLIGDWGPCPPGPPCLADLTGDGEVTFADLLLLLTMWTLR